MGAFWSLILYDATTFWLVANPINRYEIASHTDGLVYGADGSLTVAVQHDQPSSPALNWLPAPTGAYRLILRTTSPSPQSSTAPGRRHRSPRPPNSRRRLMTLPQRSQKRSSADRARNAALARKPGRAHRQPRCL